MANPVIGNSLFAVVLALMHVPPMFALLWAQRRLRRRVVVAEPVGTSPLASGSSPLVASMAASPSGG